MVCGLRDDRCEPLLSDANALLKNVNYCDVFRDLVGDLTAEIFDVSETQAETVSRPGELHPQPLVERYVNLSTHTAPIGQTRRSSRCGMPKGRVVIRISSWTVQLDTDQTTRRRPFAPSPLQRLHHYYERLRPSASHRYSGRYRQMLCIRRQAAFCLTPSTKGTPSMTSAIS